MTQPKTTFASNSNPWEPPKAKPKTSPRIINPADLSICNDPLPDVRPSPEGKYNALFTKLKYGQSLKCPQGSSPKIATALKSWLAKHKKPGKVQGQVRYGEDGTDRVWLLESDHIYKPH